MNRAALIFIVCGLFLSENTFAEVNTEVRPDWQTIFDNYASQGTIVLLEQRNGNSALMQGKRILI